MPQTSISCDSTVNEVSDVDKILMYMKKDEIKSANFSRNCAKIINEIILRKGYRNLKKENEKIIKLLENLAKKYKTFHI